jgi:hypothetical protein
MTQRFTQGGKRNTGIAAGGLHDIVTGLKLLFLDRLLQYMKRHAVLDAAGHVQVFGLGENFTRFTLVLKLDFE